MESKNGTPEFMTVSIEDEVLVGLSIALWEFWGTPFFRQNNHFVGLIPLENSSGAFPYIVVLWSFQ